MGKKLVYFFGDGKAEGNAGMKDILGGKGANLAEMTNLGVPVPPGFSISAEVCKIYYEKNKQYPEGLEEEIDANLKKLEDMMGKRLGDADDPLLVSVRSGAAISMPGMMDTILNLGMNDKAVEGLSRKTGNERFAWDAYRRFIQMFSDVAMGLDLQLFEGELEKAKEAKGVELDTDLDTDDLAKLVETYKRVYKENQGEEFPQDPKDQLYKAIGAVFGSWMNEKAIKYRKINNITGILGTAVNVQSMVFGNFGENSGTGVAFTRDPSTGEKVFFGEFLENAQGEDVVAGIRTPKNLSALKEINPKIYDQLVGLKDKLEKHYRDMQDIEFTIQQGNLFLLQTRNGKRTGAAALKVAVDMVEEGMISEEEAVGRVTPQQLDQLFHPWIDPSTKGSLAVLAKGLNASPGAATGQIVFTADEAEEWAKKGKKVLLVRIETSPEDIGGMHVAEGILTSTGGMTSHAAVVARGMGKPCVAGCKAAVVKPGKLEIEGKSYKEGEWLTIDGTTGEVFEGQVPLVNPKITDDLAKFLAWADQIRNKADREGVKEKGFGVRTNADTPNDALQARKFGAEGIGLCRTEHMFFGEGKLEIFQEMIVAESKEVRMKALDKLLPLQTKDFEGIFEAMDGYPVTIRLLDPPLHEFVPKTDADVKALAKKSGLKPEKIKEKAEELQEMNPMLGHRGCRLGITYPEIYDMQVEAIMNAACDVSKKGIKVIPEIMIPLVGTKAELEILRENAEKIVKDVLGKKGSDLEYKIGTMIEIPRAALTANEVAEVADFFSFGTNDLTQMTFGYSRDDIGSFVGQYLDMNILPEDPFQSLDQNGVGQLVSMAVEKGRSSKKELKMGICGEHGGDPASIEFCYRNGLNYVSCSPFRVPIARLAAAQSVAEDLKAKKIA
ncbi:MAG TPA: pyruvate, phosphate dikinase [Sediminispirochaeta sp.]|nr:pyruvate, phosphate dikinase [Sediminispirochaeta sp.]